MIQITAKNKIISYVSFFSCKTAKIIFVDMMQMFKRFEIGMWLCELVPAKIYAQRYNFFFFSCFHAITHWSSKIEKSRSFISKNTLNFLNSGITAKPQIFEIFFEPSSWPLPRVLPFDTRFKGKQQGITESEVTRVHP